MNMNIDALSSDQQLTFTITGTTPSNPSAYETQIYNNAINGLYGQPWVNYGFDDYRLDVLNGDDKPLYLLYIH